MSYNVLTIDEFNDNVKRLQKKYRNIKIDLNKLVSKLKENPKIGTHIVNDCYKIRLANSSIPTGKSGGFRIITYYVDFEDNIYLLTIYSKSELDSISESRINELLKQI